MFRVLLILACASSCTVLFSPDDGNPNTDPDAATNGGLWPGGFAARKSIRFDAATAVPGFVLAVAIDDSDLAALAQPDGSDISFTDEDDVPLPFEIESYAGGVLSAWVRLDVISGAPNAIRMYYGGAPGTAQQNAVATWEGHRAVWHLSDDPESSRYEDALGGAQAQLGGAAEQGDGIVGACVRFVDDVSDLAVTDDNNDKLDAADGESYTLSMWVSQDGAPMAGRGVVLSNRDPDNGTGFEFRLGPNTWIAAVDGAGNDGPINLVFGTGADLGPTWAHLAMVVDRTAEEPDAWRIQSYANGGRAELGGATNLGGQENNESFRIGGSFRGCIDEVRFADGVLTDAYIALHYDNLTVPAFLEVGPEQRPMPGV